VWRSPSTRKRLRVPTMSDKRLGFCIKCGTGDYMVLNRGIGDVVCEGCGEWQGATLNDVYERVDL
jgi:hypothetical protein